MAATAGPRGSLFAAVVEKESGFFFQRGEEMKEDVERRRCESHTRLPKNLELFPINLVLYISLSSIQVFNLKSSRRNRWVAPFLSLHKVPALSPSLPNRRVPLFLSYFLWTPLQQRTFTRHQVGWQCSRVHKFPHLDPEITFFGVRLSCSPIGNSILPDNACNPLSFGRAVASKFHTKRTSVRW